jgi:hypothetical protein
MNKPENSEHREYIIDNPDIQKHFIIKAKPKERKAYGFMKRALPPPKLTLQQLLDIGSVQAGNDNPELLEKVKKLKEVIKF